MRAEAKWQTQIARLNPLLAVMYDDGGNWNKNSSVDANGTAMLLPILYDTVPNMTAANYGKTDAQQVPTSWPDYLIIDGVTQARYEWTYTEKPYVTTPSEMQKLKNGKFGDIEDAKLIAFMIKHSKIIDDWITGNQASAQNALQGLQHALSQSNTVGGINQALGANDWWRCQLTTGITTLVESHIQNLFDQIGTITNETGMPMTPDLLMLSNKDGVNAYNKVRNFITPNLRVIDKDLKKKYGVVAFEYMDMRCVQNTKVAGEMWMLCTGTWYWQGAKKPKLVRGRIPGSMSEETVASAFQCLGTNMICANGRGTGITG